MRQVRGRADPRRRCGASDGGSAQPARVPIALGELELKGLPDPVDTVEVRWEPLGGNADRSGDAVAGPSGRAPHGGCGRPGEPRSRRWRTRASGSATARDARCSSSRVRPGSARPRCVAEAARAAFDAGACVLFGHCEEDLATPYQLFAEALGHYVTHAPEEQLVAHVEAHGSELARLVPALASRIPDLPPSKATDSDTERFLLFAAVVGLLSTGVEHQPVVLVLDDLQWADKASLQLLRHSWPRPTQSMRVLVLGTYRDSELSRPHPFARDACGAAPPDGVSRIELTGLDDTGVVVVHGGGRRSHPRRRAVGARPRRVSRDRRQPVLRERGPAPPDRDRRDLPGRERSLGRAETPSSRSRCPTASAR